MEILFTAFILGMFYYICLIELYAIQEKFPKSYYRERITTNT